jgi:murein DD-endopeptidase MepM/ murein hydrolase activator NlpD
MAIVSGFTKSTEDLLQQTSAIKSSIFATKKSFSKINKVFERRTKIRSEIFRNRQLVNTRKIEALNRKEQKEAFEAARLTIRRPGAARVRLSAPGKGFLGRIMDFISSLAIGWILSNLPTWIKWGQTFYARMESLWTSLSNFVGAAYRAVVSFGDTIKNVSMQIADFNFAALPGEVQKGMNELEKQFGLMSAEFEKGFGLFDDLKLEDVTPQETTEPTPQEQSGASLPPSYMGPSMAATGGAKASPYIYSGYGPRTRPTAGASTNHGGVDISGGPWQAGTPISVIKPGTVVETRDLGRSGWGKYVVIKHDDGTYSLYGHLSQINVSEGTRIKNESGAATVIGKVGSTGVSTGPHLHFELGSGWNGTITGKVNPASQIDNYVRGGGNVKVTQTSQPATIANPTPQQTLMGQPAPSGGTLSTAQLVSLAKQVGMTKQVNVAGYSGPLDVLMGAVAMQESRGKSTSMRSDTEVYGLWQIRWPVHAANLRKIGITSPQQLYDPLLNAKAAKMIYESQGITAWSGFTDGNYKKFLPDAQRAAGVAPGQFTAMQQQNVSGSITPSREGEVVFAEFPASGAAVPPGYGGGGGSAGVSAISSGSAKGQSELLNTFIKNRLLVELSYL